jgi:hypothetical protein
MPPPRRINPYFSAYRFKKPMGAIMWTKLPFLLILAATVLPLAYHRPAALARQIGGTYLSRCLLILGLSGVEERLQITGRAVLRVGRYTAGWFGAAKITPYPGATSPLWVLLVVDLRLAVGLQSSEASEYAP